MVDPADADDLAQAHALQDAIQVEPASSGVLDVPSWDEASHAKVRDALLILNETLPDMRGAAGRRGDVDPVRHLIVTASGWGANPDQDVIYLNVTATRKRRHHGSSADDPRTGPGRRVLVSHGVRRHRPLPQERPRRVLDQQHYCDSQC
jgi:hypothetical protein